MYVIHIGQRAEHRTTLAGVLQYLNDDRDGKAVPRVEDIAVRHVERGAIPVERLTGGNFAVRPVGTRRAILSMILDEVDRFIVRVGGKTLRPHEMSRAAWGAVVAAGRLAYFPAEAIDMSQDDTGPLFQTADLFEEQGSFDIADYICGEFIRRFGYGTNGPLYHPTAPPNCRHEVHVAYALMRGEKVRECIINTYRENPHHARSEFWMRPLIEVPALRGALSPSVLQALCQTMRGEKLEITTYNVGKLIAALRDVPSDGHYVHVDDALFAAGILLPRTMPTPKPLEGENAQPATKLAARIRTLVCQRQYQASVDRAAEEREAFSISQREFDRRTRAAAIGRDTYGYEWPNRVALAVMERNVAAVLQIFDGPKDWNTESKRALREEYGVDVLQCTAAERRRRLFELCGFSDAEQAEWEAQEATAKARKRADSAVAEAKSRAEGTTYRIETGQAMNGREYVDFCINAGFSKLVDERRGSVRRYWIHDPVKRISRPLRAKDGTLDYARARLTQSFPEAIA
ncbi:MULTISPECIES: flotillin family protein [Cupriavidus]|uniref:hypothetical protein n=1 Tax=Cupriavidus TaxID=106589 RepID=UPI001247E57C|nr:MULTISPECIES: hypothetical protein [Cupriavidus]KAB0599715.1 hypothetical protein F7R19_24525 [Cupriavidus pauculus]KAI3593400.1 hypothetical protein D9X30_1552 [Cupriavidus sp. U2]MBY4733510.1 hypothetical protein [Cupriavidus pauculus]UAL03753.1 hypothetical protein K8O84_28770 [Cupriavidus pauculus]